MAVTAESRRPVQHGQTAGTPGGDPEQLAHQSQSLLRFLPQFHHIQRQCLLRRRGAAGALIRRGIAEILWSSVAAQCTARYRAPAAGQEILREIGRLWYGCGIQEVHGSCWYARRNKWIYLFFSKWFVRLIDWLIDQNSFCFIHSGWNDWLIDWLICCNWFWLIDSFIHWFIVRLINWVIVQLIDWRFRFFYRRFSLSQYVQSKQPGRRCRCWIHWSTSHSPWKWWCACKWRISNQSIIVIICKNDSVPLSSNITRSWNIPCSKSASKTRRPFNRSSAWKSAPIHTWRPCLRNSACASIWWRDWSTAVSGRDSLTMPKSRKWLKTYVAAFVFPLWNYFVRGWVFFTFNSSLLRPLQVKFCEFSKRSLRARACRTRFLICFSRWSRRPISHRNLCSFWHSITSMSLWIGIFESVKYLVEQ